MASSANALSYHAIALLSRHHPLPDCGTGARLMMNDHHGDDDGATAMEDVIVMMRHDGDI